MLSEKIQDAMNDQINAELHSAYLYLSMVAYFDSINLNGFAQWMKVQAQEEVGHAMRFFEHVNQRQGRVGLQPIAEVKTGWGSPLEAFRDAYKHEQYITGRIHELVALAESENDYAARSFLKWFVDEQVEEEDNASGIVEKLKMIGDKPQGLLMLDANLGRRGSEGSE